MPIKKSNIHIEPKILSLWSSANSKDQLISFKEIVETLGTDGVSERTVARHLLKLVTEKKLQKIVQGYNKVFYIPDKPFWDTTVNSSQISEESLSRIGSYVTKTLSKTIEESKKTTERYEAQVWNEISSSMSEAEKEGKKDTTKTFTKAMDKVLNEKKITSEEKVELQQKVDSLLNDLLTSLTNPAVFARLERKEELPYTLFEEDIWNIVRNFMDTWAFLYTHPWAVPECQKYLKRKLGDN